MVTAPVMLTITLDAVAGVVAVAAVAVVMAAVATVGAGEAVWPDVAVVESEEQLVPRKASASAKNEKSISFLII